MGLGVESDEIDIRSEIVFVAVELRIELELVRQRVVPLLDAEKAGAGGHKALVFGRRYGTELADSDVPAGAVNRSSGIEHGIGRADDEGGEFADSLRSARGDGLVADAGALGQLVERRVLLRALHARDAGGVEIADSHAGDGLAIDALHELLERLALLVRILFIFVAGVNLLRQIVDSRDALARHVEGFEFYADRLAAVGIGGVYRVLADLSSQRGHGVFLEGLHVACIQAVLGAVPVSGKSPFRFAHARLLKTKLLLGARLGFEFFPLLIKLFLDGVKHRVDLLLRVLVVIRVRQIPQQPDGVDELVCSGLCQTSKLLVLFFRHENHLGGIIHIFLIFANY